MYAETWEYIRYKFQKYILNITEVTMKSYFGQWANGLLTKNRKLH